MEVMDKAASMAGRMVSTVLGGADDISSMVRGRARRKSRRKSVTDVRLVGVYCDISKQNNNIYVFALLFRRGQGQVKVVPLPTAPSCLIESSNFSPRHLYVVQTEFRWYYRYPFHICHWRISDGNNYFIIF